LLHTHRLFAYHIEAGDRIGLDAGVDGQRFHVSPKGVVVIPGGPPSFYARLHGGRGGGGMPYNRSDAPPQMASRAAMASS